MRLAHRVTALSCWAFATWVLLTWTLTLEQMLFGAAISVAVAVALSPTVYLDVALWLASFSYLGAIVWSRYLERGLL